MSVSHSGLILVSSGHSEHNIEDPYSSHKLLNAERLGYNSDFMPFLLVYDPSDEMCYLFFIVKSDPSTLICWKLDQDYKYRDQYKVKLLEFIDYCHIFGITSVNTLLSSKAINASWQPMVENIQSRMANRKSKLSLFIKDSQTAYRLIDSIDGMWGMLKTFHSNYADPTAPLEKAIKKFCTTREEQDLIFQMYALWKIQTVDTRAVEAFMDKDTDSLDPVIKKGVNFFRPLISSWQTILLRECFYFIHKQQICFSPFSGKWLLSQKTIYAAMKNKRGGVRITLYQDDRLEFIEFSGYGFLNTVNGYILPIENMQFVLTSPRENPATWFRDELADTEFWRSALIALKSATNDVDREEYVLINNNVDRNLGHLLWNDISGVFTFYKVIKELGIPDKVNLGVLSHNIGNESKFSSISHSDVLLDFLHSQNRRDSPVIINSGKEPTFYSKYIYLTFKSLFIQDELQVAYRTFFTHKSMMQANINLDTGTHKIFFNVRTHNKALLNFKDCITALAQTIQVEVTGEITLILEGDTDAEIEIKQIVEICAEYDIACQYFIRLNIYQLYAVLQQVDLIIAPVGSGLVLPTWILDKPCITHADPMHMSQLGWWEMIVNKKLNLESFSIDDIKPVSNAFYSSYTISPPIFVEKIMTHLSKLEW